MLKNRWRDANKAYSWEMAETDWYNKKSVCKGHLRVDIHVFKRERSEKDVGKKPDYTEGDERKAVGRKDLVEASPVVMDRGT